MNCDYHHGQFVPDSRGCCSVCGAPKLQEPVSIDLGDDEGDSEYEDVEIEYPPNIVRPGESWASIAERLYGTQRAMVDLIEMNPTISNLRPGMVIQTWETRRD